MSDSLSYPSRQNRVRRLHTARAGNHCQQTALLSVGNMVLAVAGGLTLAVGTSWPVVETWALTVFIAAALALLNAKRAGANTDASRSSRLIDACSLVISGAGGVLTATLALNESGPSVYGALLIVLGCCVLQLATTDSRTGLLAAPLGLLPPSVVLTVNAGHCCSVSGVGLGLLTLILTVCAARLHASEMARCELELELEETRQTLAAVNVRLQHLADGEDIPAQTLLTSTTEPDGV